MRGDKNACPGAATPKQADSKAFFQSDTLACFDSIAKDDCPSMGRIAEFLGHGSENAVTSAELAVICSFKSRRDLRRQVERERREGALILADKHGLFLPSQDPAQARQEIQQFVNTAESRSKSLLRTIKAARHALRQCDGQTHFSEVSTDATP